MQNHQHRTAISFLTAVLAILYITLFASPAVSADYADGDSIRLARPAKNGVPLHPGSGVRDVSEYLPDQAGAVVKSVDPKNNWIDIQSGSVSGWIVRKYIGEVKKQGTGAWVPLAEPVRTARTLDTPPPVRETPGAMPPEGWYTIGTWNLEHFRSGAPRGFPEYNYGGDRFPPRSMADYDSVATAIKNLDAAVLVLEEINSTRIVAGADTAYVSIELDTLVMLLGSHWKYIIGGSHPMQNIAMVYNTSKARLNGYRETKFPNIKVQDKEIFDRQPLIANFTLLKNDIPKNDLTVVGLHMASGQHLNANHDSAMTQIVSHLQERNVADKALPVNEKDIVITGDFNAGRFDKNKENFWDELELNGWDVLADDENSYPATRLSGNPLKQGNSRIDYIIVTKGNGGLAGEEVIHPTATIHSELLRGDPVTYRRHFSDHIPVTVQVQVMEDGD